MAGSTPNAQALYAHLATKCTTTCRCWLLQRKDGWTRGFTDHDADISFDGMVFGASSGVTASALETTTGLAVNNSETVGALSDAGISEADIEAGRFDEAQVTCWLVNWVDPNERVVRFTGTLGEVTRNDGAFGAELRGLTDALNRPRGRLFQRSCSAVLGDSKCRFNLNSAGYFAEFDVADVEDARVIRFSDHGGFSAGWFERGRLRILDGAGSGLIGWIKNDLSSGGMREVTLWQGLRADVRAGDRIRLEAGCNKTASQCAMKFNNFMNFRGCPHIPGEDWLTSYPRSGEEYDGGSMNAPIVS
ncbi:DUF2163 domain-containing protein [Tropicimonas sp. IMCC6043]|uniref:DUF2163 domain-containing protein n=1 Tax=Tropicimonas sp. IMCC6043 TaxID=2510645 RepID=UPI00101DCF41|nr:DUF2163 domain-containing protein [Tropicimonas sp. IMCC6043]RYH11177.1 DUF2163 domain-containing protein [Tropicimonas sp. IMCC6043]